ncbi:carbohydrate ABC transporter permease [uncultured Kushneria sp.]|uniref:carbohydrate ABC transporter permease n=1 Tax=uncultured Kushneria sp. TaxID=905033 RepID=UPI0026063F58|nr:sugar ABC transporter permease [uncultured Kushneria sp.]
MAARESHDALPDNARHSRSDGRLKRSAKAWHRERGTRVRRQRVRAAWLFLTPMLIVLAAVAGWPLIRTFWFSLTDASLSSLDGAQFIGVENYLVFDDGWYGILADPLWWQSVWNTLYFTLVSVSLEAVLGVIVALVLNARFRGRTLVRAAMLIPWAIPTVVSARIWAWMLNDQFGIINHMLLGLGLIDAPLSWTADASLSMWAVIMVDVWKATPFVALLVLAALQMLPSDCYEAARVDGIHPVRVFFRVTLPLITPALLVAVIFRALDALRVFDVIYVLTSNAASTMTMSIYARQQLVEFQDVGYGSAASTLLFMIIALVTVVYLYLGRRQLGGGQ